jgi:protein-S-isoprenylcysteine O-methyltransferase Ste14
VADAVQRRERRSLAEALARRRVPLGFAVAIAAVILARPTWDSWRIGLLLAAVGEAIRVWAAGHLEKSREVTRSGPYRLTRHPLYAGSTVIAAGVIVASRSGVLTVLVTIYMAATIAAAIRQEEAFLTTAFGDTYDRYRRSDAEPMRRRFSLERALRNREYRAVIGLLAGFAILALKLMLSI